MPGLAEQGGRAHWRAPYGDASARGRSPASSPVVPDQRLLEAAAALADGATEVHARLQDLDTGRHDELLEVLTLQLNHIVGAWVGLVLDILEQDRRGGAVQRVREPLSATRSDSEARDDLTGLLDRPAGFAAVRRQMERARQRGEPVVVGYLDVNAMRRVNDTRGIHAGDELLRSVGASLRTVLREHDVVARVGGDRFVFAMVGVDTPQARERFLSFVVSPEEAYPPSRIVRIGFAELRSEDTVKDLVARAEAAMAKPPV